MTLPDWIDLPVPDVEVDSHDDAIGKLVAATQEVEAWLALLAHRLGAAAGPRGAARLRATQLVVKIRQRVDLVPQDDQVDLRAALRRTSALLDFRNAVVHAMPPRFELGTESQARLRPPPPERFAVEELVGAALAGRAIAHYFDAKVSRWPQRHLSY